MKKVADIIIVLLAIAIIVFFSQAAWIVFHKGFSNWNEIDFFISGSYLMIVASFIKSAFLK